MEGGIFLLLLLFHFSEWAGLSGSPLGNRGGEGDGGGARVIINGDYFCPHTFPGRISAGRRRRVPRAPVPSCSQPGGRGGRSWVGERGARERIAASSAPRGPAGRGGAGASRERRGRAGCGAARPQPRHSPAPLSLPHAGPPLCSPLSPALLSLTHPRGRRISSLGRGMPPWRTGLGPSNGSCSTAPRLHRRERRRGPRRPGEGPRLPCPRGAGEGTARGQTQSRSPPPPAAAGGATPAAGTASPSSGAVGHGIASAPGTAPGASSPLPSALRQGLGGKGMISPLSPDPVPRGLRGSAGKGPPGAVPDSAGRAVRTGGGLAFVCFWASLYVCTPEAVSADKCPRCTLWGVRLHPLSRGCSEAWLLFFRGKDGSVGVGVPVVRIMGSFRALS